ncbi:acyl-CoA dehydrogenase, C-terminal domain protein [Mycobacterium xenopi 4042]|uniref:Acyl-CoA dehydrogenase, C-terminal domain protein n=1 Tax=Mycobacterium xenopi 4042 TaxID=1299334 RepID=X7ZVH9_MYCXE|nr:acyl-CoA dehydrogenase, C-terminal domain protein [Mycobacterium xenopi 4042]
MQDVEEFRPRSASGSPRTWLANSPSSRARRPRPRTRGVRGAACLEPAPGQGGLTCLGWPVEHGGRGLSVAHRVAFYEEYAIANAPAKVNHFGEELLGPTLIAYGTPEQQQRFLPKILDVTELWCQGYSEPGAGSDLANVSTTAVLDGDHWVINGQKVWTSLAHWAQWCFVLARTEKGSKRHAGLSYLLVPLDQPGVKIHPIVQLTADSEFNEVFFDDARTDADLVVGAPGDGWRIAMATLTFERGVSTVGQQIVYARELNGVVELAKRTGAADDPLIRERLTRSWAGLRAMRSYALATMDVEQPGQDNVSKLLWANWHRELGEIAMDVRASRAWYWKAAISTSGSGSTCSLAPIPFTAVQTKSSATSLPSGCSACPERSRDDACRRTERGSRTRTFSR